MSTHSVGWVRIGASSAAARAVFVTIAAAGHLLFLWSLTWSMDHKGVVASLLALPNVVMLAVVAFRPRPRALTAGRAVGAVVALTTLAGLAVYLLATSRGGFELRTLLYNLGLEVVCGALGATVAAPLSLALDRWRLDPTPRRALDAWATLVCVAAVFAFVRPVGFSQGVAHCPGGAWFGCHGGALGRTLAGLDAAMAVAALAGAVGLWSFERGARRWLAAAIAGGIPGLRVADEAAVDAASAPHWGLSDEGPARALLADATDASYRDNATGAVVARVTASADASWREQAMIVVAILCGTGLLGRVIW
ncbi:MAG: hypothetical protein JWM10_850 [Myxococcaceae bacterium]|nr:hypothetical protein [Myxococcaceae bacterium]